MSELSVNNTDAIKPPIFIYGSLRMGQLQQLVGENASTETNPAYVRGLRKGMGDLFLCADITQVFTDKTEGELCYLNEASYETSLEILDEYEGVSDGYYERHLVFAHKFSKSGLFIPAWVYSRGQNL